MEMFRFRKGKYTSYVGIPLAITGWIVAAMPVMAQTTTSYFGNDYRGCAAKLLRLGITPEAASSACAAVLRPRELSNCVTRIQKQTQVAATDILSSCRSARRPEDLGTCVVSISASKKETFDPSTLNYCSSSLLPVRFAECVVGLRREIDFSATQAMSTCIDASDRLGGLLPSFIPASRTNIDTPVPSQQPTQFNRTFETTPIQPSTQPVPQRN
jgi:hypothetical protein